VSGARLTHSMKLGEIGNMRQTQNTSLVLVKKGLIG